MARGRRSPKAATLSWDLPIDSPLTEVLDRLRPHTRRGLPMLIGAEARNLIHAHLGHAFGYSSTRDIDISFAMPDWSSYQQFTQGLRPLNDSGIAFDVAGHHVDLIPFGPIESSSGTLVPPWRMADPIDVFAMSAVYEGSDILHLAGEAIVKIPTVAGYAALKIKAWIDRSVADRGIYKDGADLGLVLFWYENIGDVQDRLWGDEAATLKEHDYDLGVASARLLGSDIRAVLGAESANLLVSLWTAESRELLVGNIVPRDYRSTLKLGDTDQIAGRLTAFAEGLSGR